MAAMAAEKVEMTLRRTEDAFLDRLQAALRSATPPARDVDELLIDSPLICRLYLVDRRGELLYPGAWREGDAAIFGPLVSGTALRKLERNGKREVIADNQVCLALLAQRSGEPVLVAFIRDTDTLRREILETTLGALESSTIIAVLDHEGRTVYSRAPIGDAQRVLSVRFHEALPDWRLAVYQTPARRRVRRSAVRSCSSPAPSGARGRHRGGYRHHMATDAPGDRDGPAQIRFRRQRLSRSEDPALRDPDVRGDPRDGARGGRRPATGILPGHHP